MNRIKPSKRACNWVSLLLSTFLLAPYLAACSSDRALDSPSGDSTFSERSPTAQSSKNTASKGDFTLRTDRPYLNRLLPEAQRIQQEYGIPIETTLAIAVHETGWGKFEIGKNNHFGLRCASGDCITLTNNSGANVLYETCPDEAECFDIFARSLTELSNGQPSDLAVIYKNGYATSPSWVRKVRRIRRQVRRTLKKAGIETSG